MEVVYSRKIGQQLASNKSLRRAYPSHYSNVKALLDDLRRVEHLREITLGNPHPLKGDRQGQLAISVGRTLRMVLAPGPDDLQHGAKAVNWRAVKQIQIVEITDYHK